VTTFRTYYEQTPNRTVPFGDEVEKAAAAIRVWLADRHIKTLNVTGNRASQFLDSAFITVNL
jgi:hypothetical protein